MSILEKNTINKGRVDQSTATQLEFKASDNNEVYELKEIYDNAIFVKKSDAGHLLGLYYLIL